eukprot:TRINITY_DN7630_c0_g1_i1.p1 TRINITY_DN7630_c0_g1~~TRINITY_DN7630_c0_g1_i1.p1  ORF type:complete len:408 (-),score=137.97 TRINITY_DN7630_c0_g1_i1:45-1157(-)
MSAKKNNTHNKNNTINNNKPRMLCLKLKLGGETTGSHIVSFTPHIPSQTVTSTPTPAPKNHKRNHRRIIETNDDEFDEVETETLTLTSTPAVPFEEEMQELEELEEMEVEEEEEFEKESVEDEGTFKSKLFEDGEHDVEEIDGEIEVESEENSLGFEEDEDEDNVEHLEEDEKEKGLEYFDDDDGIDGEEEVEEDGALSPLYHQKNHINKSQTNEHSKSQTTSATSSQKLTARQQALLNSNISKSSTEAPDSGSFGPTGKALWSGGISSSRKKRKAPQTDEAVQRKAEMAARRKRVLEKQLLVEKQNVIDKLLSRSSKSRRDEELAGSMSRPKPDPLTYSTYRSGSFGSFIAFPATFVLPASFRQPPIHS